MMKILFKMAFIFTIISSLLITSQSPTYALTSKAKQMEEQEPNGQKEISDIIYPTDTMIGYFDTFYDKDYYEMYIEEYGQIVIKGGEQQDLNEDFIIELRNESDEIIQTSEYIEKDGHASYQYIKTKILDPGTYFIVVISKNGILLEHQYTITTLFQEELEPPTIESLQFDQERYMISLGDELDLQSKLNLPENYTYRLEWNIDENLGDINSQGKLTTNRSGTGQITATYKDITATSTIIIGEQNKESERRAILIGNSDYPGNFSDLRGPKYDIMKIETMLENSNFGSAGEFVSIDKYNDVTKYQVQTAIQQLIPVTGGEDITYFYYSGHGNQEANMSSLSLIDEELAVSELKAMLDKLPGTKIVILDSCFSGGFINKGSDENTNLKKIDENIVKVFSKANKGYLNEGKYKVITASSKTEYSVEYDGDPPYGLFTKVLVDATGYNYGSYPSDIDGDGALTLDETYDYIYGRILQDNPEQHVQIYPSNSDYQWLIYQGRSTVKVKGISFESEEKQILEQDQGQIEIQIQPADATNQGIYYYVEDPEILQITSDGRYQALQSGETTLHAISIDGLYEATQKIIVGKETIKLYKNTIITDPQKIWTIELNQEANQETLEENVYVSKTGTGTKIPGITLEIQDKNIKVNPPESGWELGRNYYLHILKNLTSTTGKSLNEDTVVKFKLEQDQ